jgi:hypothetical protein
MDSATKSHFYEALERATITEEPFPHLYATDIFPREFYQHVRSSLPAIEQYKQYSARYPARYVIDLMPSTVKGLAADVSGFWTDFEGWLNSSELMGHMTRKFGDRLKCCYTDREGLVKAASTPEGITITPQSLLSRDFSRYAIDPHTDAGPKFVVGVFYFPKDGSLLEFGTSIYRPKDASLKDFAKSVRFRRDDFELVRTMENRPNSLFMFLKTDQSFHGVEQRSYSNVGRDVLFWIPRIGKAKTAEKTISIPADVFTPRELVA